MPSRPAQRPYVVEGWARTTALMGVSFYVTSKTLQLCGVELQPFKSTPLTELQLVLDLLINYVVQGELNNSSVVTKHTPAYSL
jgi:hypothetical protein